jgi:TPR repeat protein
MLRFLSCALVVVAIAGFSTAQVTSFQYEGAYPAQVDDYIQKANNGDMEAAYKLGFMYAFLFGHQDPEKAVQWLSKAADGGHIKAEAHLAQFYREGKGVAKDEGKARELWTRSAEGGFAEAQVRLCLWYHAGTGTPKDPVAAFQWCKKAAEQGDVFGELLYGQMYMRGEGVAADEIEGEKWIAKSAAQGFGPAQGELAQIKAGPHENLPGMPAEGVTVVAVVASPKPSPLAEAELEKLEQAGKTDEDAQAAAKLYRSAMATSASPVDWYELARLYEQGKGVSKDDAKALQLLLKSAEQEFMPALYRLGEKYREGDGVTQNNAGAYTWFALAASFGNTEAKRDMLSAGSYLNAEQLQRAQSEAFEWVREYPKITSDVNRDFDKSISVDLETLFKSK